MRKKQYFRKPRKIKRKKSLFQQRFFWITILMIFATASIFYFFIFSSFFQVRNIIILGQEKINEQDIRIFIEKKITKKILFLKTRSIFLINSKETENNILDSFPQISEIKITKKFPDALDIIIQERLGKFTWCYEEKCFLLDNQGVIFEQVFDNQDSNYIRIKDLTTNQKSDLGQEVIKKQKLSQILNITKRLDEDLEILVQEISILSDQRLNVRTTNGWEIYFNTQKDIDWQITELDLILKKKIPFEKKQEIEYIDLRFDKIYIFPDFSQ